VWRSPSNSFPIPRTPQRGIFTNISQLKTSHSRGSTRTRRSLECQLTVDFLASFFSRGIRRRTSIQTLASPRTHHPGNSTENRLCLPVAIRFSIRYVQRISLSVSYTCKNAFRISREISFNLKLSIIRITLQIDVCYWIHGVCHICTGELAHRITSTLKLPVVVNGL